jgi:O-antigen/teichoic acid export membrane protein
MGLGKSKFMLMMNVVSLVFAVTMNSICIPLFGIAGAALSCMSYQILQCTWMNLYLRKMGFWPYRMSLLVQVAWIVAIIVTYIALNTVVSATLFEKGVAYGIVILLLLLTFWKQGLAKKNF